MGFVYINEIRTNCTRLFRRSTTLRAAFLAFIWIGSVLEVAAQQNLSTLVDFVRQGDQLIIDVKLADTDVLNGVSQDDARASFARIADGMLSFGERFAEFTVSTRAGEKRSAPQQFQVISPIPSDAQTVTFYWPIAFDAVVLRQRGVSDPFSGYFARGQTTPSIMLSGGTSRSETDIALEKLVEGVQRVLPGGYSLILFAIAIFLKRARFGEMATQIATLAFGHMVALLLLTLYSWGPPAIVASLIVPSLTVVCAVDNIIWRGLHFWRLIALALFAALQSFHYAQGLEEAGLSKVQSVPATLGFSTGLLLGMAAVLVGCYIVLGVRFGHKPKFRGRVIMPASLGLIGVVMYQNWI